MNTADQLKRIKELLGAVTGFEDDDQQYVDDARDAVQKLIEALAEQPAQQEPVATVTSETGADISMSWWHEPALPVGTKLYTSPPAQRTWVGLSDEEKSDIWCVVTNRDFVTEDTHVYADAIEAKLKEKNNG